MFDIRLIREDKNKVVKALAAKNISFDPKIIEEKDAQYKEALLRLDDLRSEKNKLNDAISGLLKEKKDPKDVIASMKAISAQISQLEPDVKKLKQDIDDVLIGLPNLAHASVPVGGVDCNQVVREWEKPVELGFKVKTHIEIAEDLDIIDFKRATKITGSNFILYKKAGARLERALYNFMLDVHTEKHGYTEVLPPILVNRASMTGTGQLPKMADDMYKVEDEELYLIPTAEVPVTNIHRDEILKEEELPVKYAAYTPCFRKEAGSYGKDTKGLIRVHQFDKVELVKFTKPEDSYNELEKLVTNAETIFQLLKLPYRILLLASGDLSFAAAKCYDIEAHAVGVNAWLEVSSCSNFEDFQARRASIRFKGKETKKPTFVHTLNGSGVALARTMVAILENYQNEDGSVNIPDVLQPYMGGMTKIEK